MIVRPDNHIELGPLEPGTSEDRGNSLLGGNASIRNVAVALRTPLNRASSNAGPERTISLNTHKERRITSCPSGTKFGSPVACDMQGYHHFL